MCMCEVDGEFVWVCSMNLIDGMEIKINFELVKDV